MQSRWPIRAFGLCRGKMQQALGSLAYCLPHSALKFPPPSPSHATRSLRLLVGAFPAACRRASCLPIQLLAVFRLLACLPPPPPRLHDGRLLSFSGCLPGRPAACRAPAIACLPSRLLAGFRGRFPSLRAACPPRVIRGIPFSTCSLFVSTCQLVVCRASSCLFRCFFFVVNCCRTRTSGLLSG